MVALRKLDIYTAAADQGDLSNNLLHLKVPAALSPESAIESRKALRYVLFKMIPEVVTNAFREGIRRRRKQRQMS